MQTLIHGELEKQYPEALVELEQNFDNLQGVKVVVDEDYKNSVVVLTIGKNELFLTIGQARDIAFEIRKAANRIEKHDQERGVKSNNIRRKTKRGKR